MFIIFEPIVPMHMQVHMHSHPLTLPHLCMCTHAHTPALMHPHKHNEGAGIKDHPDGGIFVSVYIFPSNLSVTGICYEYLLYFA